MRVVAQAHAFQTTHIASGREGESAVNDLWSTLGYPFDRRFHNSTDFVAMKLIWSCRAPLVHPWLTRKSLSLIHSESLNRLPITDRKIVLYMTRSNGLTKNSGRRILNEDLLLSEIQRVLDVREQGEVLQVFNHEDFGKMSTLMKHLQLNVKAIIGPHGGALYNHFWTAQDTLVIEFQPISRPDLTFFESAKLRDHAYAVLMLESADDEHNMVVDIPAVTQILEERLGQEVADGDRLRAAYDWEAEELGVK